MKHYKHYTSAEFLSIFGMSSPPVQIEAPRRNAKPPIENFLTTVLNVL